MLGKIFWGCSSSEGTLVLVGDLGQEIREVADRGPQIGRALYKDFEAIVKLSNSRGRMRRRNDE